MIEIEPKQAKGDTLKDDDLVCYCFKYTKKDIENDWRENGRSLIYRKVAAEKKSGRCNCATLNPRGR
ncbi:MAG: BFD-like (2Fe-2S) protein [Deltaproteobacteria bacterium HGW-Deltaproteobacteria-21]|jgi:hypothetical protein|nr:MAG: BFD-like (2Fe-2S) protein [Deltaproteobacteria bacterium HGW-Deltaproteobacteria-21]